MRVLFMVSLIIFSCYTCYAINDLTIDITKEKLENIDVKKSQNGNELCLTYTPNSKKAKFGKVSYRNQEIWKVSGNNIKADKVKVYLVNGSNFVVLVRLTLGLKPFKNTDFYYTHWNCQWYRISKPRFDDLKSDLKKGIYDDTKGPFCEKDIILDMNVWDDGKNYKMSEYLQGIVRHLVFKADEGYNFAQIVDYKVASWYCFINKLTEIHLYYNEYSESNELLSLIDNRDVVKVYMYKRVDDGWAMINERDFKRHIAMLSYLENELTSQDREFPNTKGFRNRKYSKSP